MANDCLGRHGPGQPDVPLLSLDHENSNNFCLPEPLPNMGCRRAWLPCTSASFDYSSDSFSQFSITSSHDFMNMGSSERANIMSHTCSTPCRLLICRCSNVLLT